MTRIGPRLNAVISVVLGAVSAVVTNLVTQRWSWTLGAFLVVLTVALAVLAGIDHKARAGTTVTQKKIMSLSSRPGWMKLAGSVARRRRSRLARSSPSKRMTLGPVW